MSSPRSLRRRRDRTRTRTAVMAVCALMLVIAVVGTGYTLRARTVHRAELTAQASPSPLPARTPTSNPAPTPSSTPTPTSTPTRPADRTYAATGPDTYLHAAGQSAVFGAAGALSKYRVAIETDTPVPVEEFADMVDNTLSDRRGWIAGNNVRLQRISADAAGAAFTVFLVTPGTAQKLCLAGGYDIYWRGEPYTSCRVGAKVIINISRYLKAVPNYGAPLESYQRYAINHEVGHALGHGHELCPGKGKPAPVMQQQTFDLQGCVAYSWPYLEGTRYAGPPGRIVPSG